ncbi:hypothetical protein P4H71_15375 [Paenibacillus kribbensis]|uniref:hypothetical protein n=1 Tax=Paenibacillus kribbensis TaxID=172713 RepID=UPI002DB5FD50|nr:hypothetical protein [Paenibacillus kribbensis]MEC0235710.1 hypothetical protein [Paenibacillus kribbensis]
MLPLAASIVRGNAAGAAVFCPVAFGDGLAVSPLADPVLFEQALRSSSKLIMPVKKTDHEVV